MAPLKRIVSIC